MDTRSLRGFVTHASQSWDPNDLSLGVTRTSPQPLHGLGITPAFLELPVCGMNKFIENHLLVPIFIVAL